MVKLVLRQGIDAGYFWPIVDAAGAPFDLTGWSVIAQVRTAEAPDAPLLHAFTTGVLADPAPAVTISWTAEESLAWAWRSGYFDVILVSPEGRPVRVVSQGIALVDKVVSHA